MQAQDRGGGGGRIIASEQALLVRSSGGASPSPLPSPTPVPQILAKAVQEWYIMGEVLHYKQVQGMRFL